MKIHINATPSSLSFKSLLIVVIWVTLAYFGAPSVIYAQEEWTYNEVLIKAEFQSIFRYQAIADNKIAKSRWAFYKTNLSPGVTLDILAPNYSKTSREIIQPDGSIAFQSVTQNNSSLSLGIRQGIKATGGTVFLQSELQRFDDFSLDNKLYNGIPFRIGFSQPIFGFNGLKWASQIEPLSLKEADRKFIIDMEDIHLRATVAFFNLLSAQLNEKIASTNSDVNVKLLDIAKERFELGKISRNELLQLELEYKLAVKDLSKARFQVQFTQGALQTFLGGDKTKNISVSTPTPKAEIVDMKIGTALDQARANRPEIIAFQRRNLEADRDINQANTQYGIKADLFVSFGLARGSQNLSDIYSDPIT
ncbi:MAG: TolC family protein, partial [Saprospiraceae bacterium]